MSPALAWGDDHLLLREALSTFCAGECPDEWVRRSSGTWPLPPWKTLCELGFFDAALPGGETGVVEIVAGMEVLGHAVFPGPLPETLFACGVLAEKEREPVLEGSQLVCVAFENWLPWGPHAEIFVDREFGPNFGGRAWLARPAGEIAPVETLSGEPWGKGKLARQRELEGVAKAHAIAEVGHAAWLAAAGQRLVEDACEHARTRKQFGKAIGEFQAVAHPLADAHMRSTAAAMLARRAAHALARSTSIGKQEVAAVVGARLSAEAAGLLAVQTAHQVFGAIGITLEGPAFHISSRIRHRVSASPRDPEARNRLLSAFELEEETR